MANIFEYGVKAADVLATKTRRGLMAAADYVKLQAISAELNGSSDYTGTPDVHLRTTNRFVFLESPSSQQFLSNLYWDGTNYQRFNVANPGVVFLISNTLIQVYTTPAGANPAVITLVGSFTPASLGLVLDPPRVFAGGGATVSALNVTWTNLPGVPSTNTGGVLGGTPATGSVFTAPVNGWYHFEASGWFATSALGTHRELAFFYNGATYYGVQSHTPVGGGAASQLAGSVDLPMVTGNTVVPQVHQDSGGALVWTNYNYSVRYLGVL
jgi:hypothetical protein